ncbi:MAG TPA: DUF4326 domain-containing protein [Terriglobales bacterium]|jgi:hypothetical protein|nr:DUF4326 domain-containing protein [Terriglobales bacterium]
MSVSLRVWSRKKSQGPYPPNAMYVGCRTVDRFTGKERCKGTIYGNDYKPFVGHKNQIADNDADFRAYAVKRMATDAGYRQAVEALKGKDLLCWCIQDGPKREPFCHARVLIDLANPRYYPDFLTPQERDDLWACVRKQPQFRKGNEYMGQHNGYLRRLSMPTWTDSGSFRGVRPDSQEAGTEYNSLKPIVHTMDEAPREVKDLAIKLSIYAGKPVNYFSLVGYADKNDHIEPHQHGEDRGRDARVFIISLGAVRRFWLSPVCDKCRVCAKCNQSDCEGKYSHCAACETAKDYRRTHCQKTARVMKYGTMYEPKSGSMIELSSQENFTHYHAILDSKTVKGLRISFNTKCIDTEETLDHFIERMNRAPNPETSKQADREEMAQELRYESTIPWNNEAKALTATVLAEFPTDTTPKNWTHKPFLTKTEADDLYKRMVNSPDWQVHKNDNTYAQKPDAFFIAYGKSYDKKTYGKSDEGGVKEEIPKIPGYLLKLARRIEKEVNCPVNYIQCHKYGPDVAVKPHRDPSGMTVPMLVVGQERTFQVGGGNTYWTGKQYDREVSWHKPRDKYLMKHGSLLTFNGGQTIHSMYPAKDDPQFNANACEWRISILFRWTTEIMRKYGPGAKDEKGKTPKYKQAYDADVKKWRDKQKKKGGK